MSQTVSAKLRADNLYPHDSDSLVALTNGSLPAELTLPSATTSRADRLVALKCETLKEEEEYANKIVRSKSRSIKSRHLLNEKKLIAHAPFYKEV